MATWIEDTGDIPDYALRYDVEEETTDGKLTKLMFTPYSVDPTGDEEKELNRYNKVEITDSQKLTDYQKARDAAEEGDSSWVRPFLPTNTGEGAMGLTGTYYRPGSGKPTAQMDVSSKIEGQYRSMVQACQKYKGAQYSACTKMVEARLAQMAKAQGFAKGGVVTAKEKDMMNYGYANGGQLDMDAIASQALDGALGSAAPMPQASNAAPATPDISADMPSLMDQDMPMAEEMPMEEGDGNLVERIISVLSDEEKMVLDQALTDYPELITILDKADVAMGNEFDGNGEVNGPGTGTSDSIPARLSDGEFVFTAKAVKQIGVDKLRKMMAKAEDDYDSGMDVQEEAQMEDMMGEDGYAMGGLLDQARKEWSSLESATAEYNQPMEMQVPTNVDGAGRQVPAGETGIMAQRTVDLASQQQTAESQRRAENTGLMSASPAQSTTGSMANEAARAQTQSNLVKGTEEEEEDMVP